MRASQTPPLAAAPIRTGRVLLAIGIILIASNLRAAITSVGPLTGMIRADTGLSNVATSLLTALPLIAFALLSPLASGFARRFGSEAVLGLSLVLLAGGILLRSVPSSLLLFAGTALLGAAIAIGNVLLPGVVKRYFPDKVGLMTGLYTTSMSVWAAIASGLSVPAAEKLGLGWRGSIGCWAVLAIAGLAAWLPQLRSKAPRPDTGLHARSAALHGSGTAPSTSGRPQTAPKPVNIWRSRLAWQVCFFMGFQSLGFYVTIAWLPDMLSVRGLSPTSAGWMLSIMQFVSLPASFIVPVLAGRFAHQRGLVAAITVIYIAGYAGLLWGGAMPAVLWIVLIGIAQGASISLALAFFGLRTSHAGQAAQLSGMAQSLGYLLAAVGPVMIGYVHDITHAWTVPLLILMGTTILLGLSGLGAGRSVQIGSGEADAEAEATA